MYFKSWYAFRGDQPIPAVIRNYVEADIPALIAVQQESFPPPFPSELWWNETQLLNHVRLFPEGALCVEIGGEIVGSMTGVRVQADEGIDLAADAADMADHTWEAMTDNGYITNHQADGNTLYVVDICIRPAFRKLKLGYWLMQSMYELVIQLGMKRLLGGGRMPGYRAYKDQWTAEQYIDAVLAGRVHDPVITFLLRCGRTPCRVVSNYLDDYESCNYGVLMAWHNPFMEPINRRK